MAFLITIYFLKYTVFIYRIFYFIYFLFLSSSFLRFVVYIELKRYDDTSFPTLVGYLPIKLVFNLILFSKFIVIRSMRVLLYYIYCKHFKCVYLYHRNTAPILDKPTNRQTNGNTNGQKILVKRFH